MAFYTSSSNPLSVQTQHEKKNGIHYLSTIQITYLSSSDSFISENDITSFTNNNCLKSLSLSTFLTLIILSAVTSNRVNSSKASCMHFLPVIFFLLPLKLIIAYHLDAGKLSCLNSQHYICPTHSAKWFLLKSTFSYATFPFVTL